ncbi:DUF563 domain-containing protein [soil metagenome]
MPLPGAVAEMHIPWHIPEAVMKARLDGRVAGFDLPEWHDGAGGAPMAGVRICRVKNAVHMPEFGAVITPQGVALHASIGEALYFTPDLVELPGVSLEKGAPVLRAPRATPRLDRAAVFMAWGGRFNYGHFLLDCMTALTALDQCGLLDRFAPIAPPLNDWQREMVSLVLGPREAALLTETIAPIVRVDDLVFASPMDHFLHAPNRPLDAVRARILASIDEPPTGVSRLYVNRMGDTKRPMVNEAELEAAMIARGFTSIAPETLPLRRQIALFRDADIVVGPTGAALANTLFCRPGCKVFEIQPTNFTSIWTRGVCHFVGVQWHGFFAPSPMSETEVVIGGMARPNTLFNWRAPLPEVLDWIDRGCARDDSQNPLAPTPLP